MSSAKSAVKLAGNAAKQAGKAATSRAGAAERSRKK